MIIFIVIVKRPWGRRWPKAAAQSTTRYFDDPWVAFDAVLLERSAVRWCRIHCARVHAQKKKINTEGSLRLHYTKYLMSLAQRPGKRPPRKYGSRDLLNVVGSYIALYWCREPNARRAGTISRRGNGESWSKIIRGSSVPDGNKNSYGDWLSFKRHQLDFNQLTNSNETP